MCVCVCMQNSLRLVVDPKFAGAGGGAAGLWLLSSEVKSFRNSFFSV